MGVALTNLASPSSPSAQALKGGQRPRVSPLSPVSSASDLGSKRGILSHLLLCEPARADGQGVVGYLFLRVRPKQGWSQDNCQKQQRGSAIQLPVLRT